MADFIGIGIEVEGTAFTVRYGKVGTDGVTKTKDCGTPEKAAAQAEKKAKEKTRKGYAEVASAAPVPAKASDQVEDWSVRSDRLQAAGDPWGQRIALEISKAEATAADRRKINKEARALEKAHADHFFGPELAALMAADNFEKMARLKWEYGYIVSGRVGAPDYDTFEPRARAILEAIAKSPAAAYLTKLAVGLFDHEGGGLPEAAAALSAGGVLPRLDSLFLGDFEYPEDQEISWVSLGDISPLFPITPVLRTLRLRGASLRLGAFEHPSLQRLEIESGGLASEAVASIAAAKLPELVHMEVWLGRDDYGGISDIGPLRPLFSTKTLPKLKHLGLQNSEIQDEVVIALATSDILAQVESVDLSMGTMQDRGAQAILDHAPRFKHLRSLNLDANFLSGSMCTRLRKALGDVAQLGGQRSPDRWDDETHYYTVVGE